MQLVEQGKVSLDALITQYIPDFPVTNGPVTIEMLLNHTSGVKNYTSIRSWWETMALEMTPKRLADVFRNEPADYAAGSNFAYSNSGYVLLGLVIERVTGRPYGGYVSEFVVAPLNLTATSYCDDQALVPGRARGYKHVDRGFINAGYVSMSQAYAAGAICSSALDLVQWTRALTRGRVVSEESYQRMTRPGRLRDGTQIEYGYGLAVSYLDEHRRIGHVGATLGFAGQLSHYDQDDVTIAVLANTEDVNAAHIESEIARAVFGLGRASTRDIPLSADELAPYAGVYDLGLTRVEVGADEGRLVVDVTLPGLEGRYRLLNQGNDRFQAESDPEISVTFNRNGQAVVGFVLVRYGITMRGRRVPAS
jgi:CubicO group peptidase (beta-lactamase class C family)